MCHSDDLSQQGCRERGKSLNEVASAGAATRTPILRQAQDEERVEGTVPSSIQLHPRNALLAIAERGV